MICMRESVEILQAEHRTESFDLGTMYTQRGIDRFKRGIEIFKTQKYSLSHRVRRGWLFDQL